MEKGHISFLTKFSNRDLVEHQPVSIHVILIRQWFFLEYKYSLELASLLNKLVMD
jgi:hypothetical protein